MDINAAVIIKRYGADLVAVQTSTGMVVATITATGVEVVAAEGQDVTPAQVAAVTALVTE